MSVTVRLSRIGKKNAPAYKIVVANTRDKRDGRSLDILGHYNPSTNPQTFDINKEKYEKWVKDGALVTEAVEKLVKGTYEFTPYNPKSKEDVGETLSETSTEEPADEGAQKEK